MGDELKTVYLSLEDADDRIGPTCPKPLANSGGYHWWYADGESMELSDPEDPILCVCKTCGKQMLLSAEADEYPICV